jgi:lysophospholipase L1-like esterase
MVKELKENDVVPILIAAPAGYSKKGMPRWAFNFYQQYYRMSSDEIKNIPATHKVYANIVRRVAKNFNTVFVDAQADFNQRSISMKPFFRNDLIHLKDKGHQALASEIYKQVSAYNSANELTWETAGRSRAEE